MRLAVAAGLVALFALLLPNDSQAAPIQWTLAAGGNGHYYEVISTAEPISWSAARTSAEMQSFLGAAGYLATLTSAAENAFITSTFANGELFGPWIGGSDASLEGDWRWVTGPEAGTPFWSGGPAGATTPPFNYANWADVPAAGFDEPNNSLGIEHYAHVLFSNVNGLTAGTWNDGQDNGGGNIQSYLVEYNAVPEPSLLSLGAVALLTAVGYRRRFR